MTRCEICGTKESNLTEVKVSGAKIQVCSECSDIGTKTEKPEEEDNTSTKYSTSNESNNKDTTQNTKTKSSNYKSDENKKSKDPFEDLSELALNYGDMIRDERNSIGLNRQELAQDLGIKESHLQGIENENTKPSVKLQNKIEKKLDIDLTLKD